MASDGFDFANPPAELPPGSKWGRAFEVAPFSGVIGRRCPKCNLLINEGQYARVLIRENLGQLRRHYYHDDCTPAIDFMRRSHSEKPDPP
jgi:hypothetical protein